MKKRLLALALCAALLAVFQVPATVAADDGLATEYTVDQPYEYPVQPQTEEWKAASLEGMDKLIELCHVDEDRMRAMTTPALLETVLNYPLLSNMYFFNSLDEGVKSVSRYFKGVELFLDRADAAECLARYAGTRGQIQEAEDTMVDVHVTVLDYYLNPEARSEGKADMTEPKAAQPQAGITTPGGNIVSTSYNLTWEDHYPLTYDTMKKAQEDFKNDHPEITIVTNPNPSYNCHSYAWYSTSTTNKHWIDDITPYLTDNSYTKQSAAGVGYKVHWTEDNHSGIVQTMAGGPNNPMVISKWGTAGVIIHPLKTCPYFGAVNYWKG